MGTKENTFKERKEESEAYPIDRSLNKLNVELIIRSFLAQYFIFVIL